MRKIFNAFNSFEKWFNKNCGWFFTNGNKQQN